MSQSPELMLRRATLDDLRVIEEVIIESVRGLARSDYTDAQIEAALGTAWAVDTDVIRDGTYVVVQAADQIVTCGGWSWRATLFGGNDQDGRRPEALDPQCDSARIRAFFVRPNWARRGIGRMLLLRCEAEARARGFRSAELMATLPGQRLYSALGYVGGEPVDHPLRNGLTIRFVPMRKKAL